MIRITAWPMRTAALLLLSLPLTAARLPAQAPTADSLKVLVAKGKTLFEGKGLCITCHGADGAGVLGPTLQINAGKAWLHTKGSAAEISALIKSGVPAERSKSESVMPPKGGSRLSDSDIELVTLYVLELHRQKPAAKSGGGTGGI